MPNARRGEVWQIDFGMAAKVRPALVLNCDIADEDQGKRELWKALNLGKHGDWTQQLDAISSPVWRWPSEDSVISED